MQSIPYKRSVKDLGSISRKLHLISACILLVPVLIGIAWLSFPLFEGYNMGYSTWHAACLSGFLIAGFGVVCWTLEMLDAQSSPRWFSVVTLLVLGFSALGLRLFGDFYWAFNRGYFLN